MTKEIFRSTSISPDEVLAGDSTEFVMKLEIGEDYIDGPSRLIFDFNAPLGTSTPTRWVNEASGYFEVYVDNPEVSYKSNAWDLDHQYIVDREHPPSREACRLVVFDFSAGLKAGDIIEFHWGETYGGFGPGAKVSSVVPRKNHEADIKVRYFEDQKDGLPDKGRSYEGYTRPEPQFETRLAYRILAREPHHLRAIRRADKTLLIPYDVFWNIADVDNADSLVEADAVPTKSEHGVFEYSDKNIQIKSKKLRLTTSSSMEDVFEGMNIYWGDIHSHSAFSGDCIQRARMNMQPEELMDYARYRSGLDFFALTDHHIPWLKPKHRLREDFWVRTHEAINSRHKDGEFVVFPAFEYTDARGDTVVVFNCFPEYAEINKPEWDCLDNLWKGLDDYDFMTIPHLHSPGSLPEGEWPFSGDLRTEPVLELYSDHGSFEREDALEHGRAWCKHTRPDRFANQLLKSGLPYGFVANSDDHKGHVGVNGITGVYSESLDRDAIFAAYRKRQVYATTNARIKLLFTANGKIMGSEIPNCSEKELEISVVGENRLKKVEIFKDGDFYQRFIPDGISFEKTVKIKEDSPSNWYVRATQLDNHIAWSSPVWFK